MTFLGVTGLSQQLFGLRRWVPVRHQDLIVRLAFSGEPEVRGVSGPPQPKLEPRQPQGSRSKGRVHM